MSPCSHNNLHSQLNYNYPTVLTNELVTLTILFLQCMYISLYSTDKFNMNYICNFICTFHTSQYRQKTKETSTCRYYLIITGKHISIEILVNKTTESQCIILCYVYSYIVLICLLQCALL